MPVELKKAISVDLRTAGLDERWLQNRIQEDPSLLGLGELEVAAREHRQPLGGRIDFLLRDPEDETYYETEVMLGSLDESHIIRTIEYWDVERQRRPNSDHRAVIVAEHITGRFFNILRLLNRCVPLIAIKLGAFQADGTIFLHPVTVLDVYEELSDPISPDQIEQTDRAFWEKKVKSQSLSVMDRIVDAFMHDGAAARLTHNRGHIALGTTGYNFCWFHPRKAEGHCHIEIRLTNDIREEALALLQERGVDASPKRAHNITLNITAKELEGALPTILELLKKAEAMRG